MDMSNQLSLDYWSVAPLLVALCRKWTIFMCFSGFICTFIWWFQSELQRYVEAIRLSHPSAGSLLADHFPPHQPPYLPGSFDKILLDAPCSALGQRPSLGNPMTSKELSSYPRLQRKLITAAVSLLKSGGTLVYSTCTFHSEENEEQISWLLNTYPEMCLQSQVNILFSSFVICYTSYTCWHFYLAW